MLKISEKICFVNAQRIPDTLVQNVAYPYPYTLICAYLAYPYFSKHWLKLRIRFKDALDELWFDIYTKHHFHLIINNYGFWHRCDEPIPNVIFVSNYFHFVAITCYSVFVPWTGSRFKPLGQNVTWEKSHDTRLSPSVNTITKLH